MRKVADDPKKTIAEVTPLPAIDMELPKMTRAESDLFTVRMHSREILALQQLAKKRGISRNKLIRQTLVSLLDATGAA